MRLIALVLLGLAGCGPRDEAPAAVDADQIKRLSTPKTGGPAVPDPARLRPLWAADLSVDPGPCRFAVSDQILVASGGSGATVRTASGLRHLVASAPVTSTGAFFEDRQLSISIGRDDASAGEEAPGPVPARMIVTNRRSGAEQRLIGLWGCDI